MIQLDSLPKSNSNSSSFAFKISKMSVTRSTALLCVTSLAECCLAEKDVLFFFTSRAVVAGEECVNMPSTHPYPVQSNSLDLLVPGSVSHSQIHRTHTNVYTQYATHRHAHTRTEPTFSEAVPHMKQHILIIFEQIYRVQRQSPHLSLNCSQSYVVVK